ncbi:MAG: nucleotidyl transferase AbiEii/AbiGii toxin family protein [Bacteroidales bacterium]|nr:nucleotidyl transferase AbiEii/AbiGii toxin family protein [Bacteroidales bacterium]
MIELSTLLGFYPPQITNNVAYHKHILKEYVELLSLEYLSRSPYIPQLAFIGGTNLRLVYGIDRFSEDLDFDCKDFSESQFVEMTNALIDYLKMNGLQVEPRDKANEKLTAFRRNIYFPGLLFELGLSGHRDERFLMKVEAQDQGVGYQPEMAMVSRCGFFFALPVPTPSVMLSMKLSALLTRAKGRDFYDTFFLWQRTEPDYHFLNSRSGIENPDELRQALRDLLSRTDLDLKRRDFEHLLFNASRSEQVLHFNAFVKEKLQ